MLKLITTIMLISNITLAFSQNAEPYFLKSWTDSISTVIEGKEYTIKYIIKEYDVGLHITYGNEEPDHSNPTYCLWTVTIPAQNFETMLKIGAIKFTDIRDNDGSRRGERAEDLLISWYADPSIINTSEFELASFKNCVLYYKVRLLTDEDLTGTSKTTLAENQNQYLFSPNSYKQYSEDTYDYSEDEDTYNGGSVSVYEAVKAWKENQRKLEALRKELNSNNSNNINNSNNNNNNNNISQYTDSRDGKTYKTVKIGNNIWMAENLAYDAGYGCKKDYSNKAYVYTLKVAQNVCPSGWHIATLEEWSKILGDNGDASGLKAKGFDLSYKTTNYGPMITWWTASENTPEEAWYMQYIPNQNAILGEILYDYLGYYGSVRCVKGR